MSQKTGRFSLLTRRRRESWRREGLRLSRAGNAGSRRRRPAEATNVPVDVAQHVDVAVRTRRQQARHEAVRKSQRADEGEAATACQQELGHTPLQRLPVSQGRI